MKINRQLEILTLLLRRERLTAPELAERLEVTRRTIGRDIDDLCRAGIPIVTRQGAGGGIAIAEGYTLDKNLLTSQELQSILTGLQSLGSVGGAENLEFLRSKLTPKNAAIPLSNTILIDLASYYKESLSVKINLLKRSIEENRCVTFDYHYEKGKTQRRIEPYFIIFRWAAWYVFGYCLDRLDFRLFKLNRLWGLEATETRYVPREIPDEKQDFDPHLPYSQTMTVLFEPSSEYLLIEEFGPDSYRPMPDGRLRFEWSYYGNLSYMLRWVLAFGNTAEVLEPPELKHAVTEEIEKMRVRYALL